MTDTETLTQEALEEIHADSGDAYAAEQDEWWAARADFEREYFLLDDGPLPGYDAYDMEYDR